jgi:hypothetical protein
MAALRANGNDINNTGNIKRTGAICPKILLAKGNNRRGCRRGRAAPPPAVPFFVQLCKFIFSIPQF